MATRYPRFEEAIKAHRASLAAGTYWRYLHGNFPAFGRLITENPNLVIALAEDAAELAAKTVGVELIVASGDTEQAA